MSARRALAGAVAALLLAGGFTVACSTPPAPPSSVSTLAPFAPGDILGDAAADASEAVTERSTPEPQTELQVRGPSGERVMVTLQTGRGDDAVREFHSVTLPYFVELSDAVTATSVSYLGDPPRVRPSAAIIECQTVRGTTVVERDSDDVADGSGLVFCSAGRHRRPYRFPCARWRAWWHDRRTRRAGRQVRLWRPYKRP